MNRISISIPKGWQAFLYVCIFMVSTPELRAQITPVFIDQAPPDETVDCFGDASDAVRLRAIVRNSVLMIDTIEVSPVDSFSAPNAACAGGMLFRIWTVIDFDGDSIRQVQEITFGPAPDGSGPTISMDQLPVLHDTVDCSAVNILADPDSYVRWISNRRIAVVLATEVGCAPIVSIEDDAPNQLLGFDCNDQLDVIFTATDLCGRTAIVVFSYSTVDTLPPVIAGVNGDTLRISCADGIPMPTVSVEDCDTIPNLTITEVTTQLLDGSCREFEFDLIRNYTATDACGNMSSITKVIEVRDTEPPNFQGPDRARLSCTEDPYDLNVTGNVVNLSDNCTPIDSLDVTFIDDVISDGICGDAFTIRRAWRVTDRCGNSRVRTQEIIVRDEMRPTYTPPVAEVSVSCADYLNTAITGEPTNMFDNCDETVNTSFTDDTLSISCPGTFVLERTWRIFDDCQNDDFFVQLVSVTDTINPVFTTAPEDFIYTCNTGSGLTSQETDFINWVNSMGGAEFTDGCTPLDSLDVQIVGQGTNEYPQFPDLNCAVGDGIVRQQFVDIIVTDLCGNVTISTMEYRQIDELPIRLLFCPESRVIATDVGSCEADVFYPPPVIQDQCSDGLPFQLILRDTQAITSGAMNQAELGSVPVDPIIFNLQINTELPVNGFTNGIFTITLENVDAEGDDEFFFIYGEDDELLGTTEQGTVQCETVITVDTLPPFLFTKYAADGIITLRLEPNIPPGFPGTFAVNNLCEGGSRAIAQLIQPVFRLTEIVYEVDVDGAGFQIVEPIDTVFQSLDIGLHQITYRATDCGGNTDECLFTITVEDREPPVLTCPADIDVAVAEDSCQITLEIPAPVDVTDNCEPYELSFEDTPEAFLPFFFDPNLGTFLAGQTSLTLTGAPVNPLDSIDLDIHVTGMFSNRRAILDVVLPDGTAIGSTERGVATCDSTGTFRIRLAATDFTAQATASGDLTLLLRPRPVTVPPAIAGDGLIPCGEDTVVNDGNSDGTTRVSISATYRTLYPGYFTTGATVTPSTSTSPDAPLPVITFNQGVTEFSYFVTDLGGNTDTCTFLVTVRDTTPPVAICQPTTLFVDPSGLLPITVDASEIDNGSFDNCGIDTIILTPNTFNCDQYGETVDVMLTINDASNNETTCQTIVSIAPLEPVPTATTSVCGGDTLRFFANPPTVAEPGQTIYTFQWFDPDNNLISTQEDFFIPGVDEDSDGAYRVVINGLTGCEATGIINVAIGSIPDAPVVSAPIRVCIGDDASLRSESVYAGNVRYEWFRGEPGAGVLVGESATATFGAPFADGQASGSFFAIVYVNGCQSAPSNVVSVGTIERPSAQVEEPMLSACELGDVTLSAQETANVEYLWTGPNDFAATGREVALTTLELSAAGTYYLQTVRSEGCFSLVDSLELKMIPADSATTLLLVGIVCPSDTLQLEAVDADGESYLFLGPNGQEIESSSSIIRVAPVTEAIIGEWRVRIRRDQCLSAPSVPVTVNLGTGPIATAATIPDPVCEGNDLILQGSSNIAGSSYRWEGPNDYSANGIAPMIPDVTASMAGQYILTTTTPTGCFAKDTLEVDVLPGIRIDSLIASSGRCLLGGEPVSLSAAITPALPDGYTYQWSGPEGTSSEAVFEIPAVSLASNGTYTLTVMNSAGCSSPRFTMQVEFDFAPAAPVRPFTVEGVTAICEGESFTLQTNDFGPGTTYLWQLGDGTSLPTLGNTLTLNDVAFALSGVYSVRVLRNGCASVPSESRTITVTPFPVITVMANDPACSGQEINFQATDLAGATYAWRGPNNFSSSLPDPTIVSADAGVHAGLYSVVAVIAGCSSDTMFVNVEVLPTPRVPVATSTGPICLSDPNAVLSLTVNENTATAGATYSWFIQNGMVAVGTPTTDLTLDLTDLGLFAGGGLFGFQVSASLNGCDSELSAPISIRIDEAGDEVADAGLDSIICEGLFLLEAAQFGSGSGRWTLVQGTGDISIANPGSRLTAVQGLTEFGGPYLFAWTLSNGSCIDFAADTVMLTVTDGEEAIAGDNLLACFGEDLVLNATATTMNGSGGEWTQGLAQEILGVVITSPTDPNTIITGLQADNIYSFTWTVTSNCGVKEDNVLVNVSDPSPFAGGDTIVCNDTRTAFVSAGDPTIGSAGSWYAVDDNTFLADPGEQRTMVSNLQIGENLFVWEMDGGICGARSRDTVSVFYSASPRPIDDTYDAPFQGAVTFDPRENDELPDGAVISFLEGPEEGGELIDNGDGTFTYQAPPNFAGEVELRYEVLSDGCELTTARVFILVGKDVACDVPNIFTPNNDRMNDNFVVPCLLNTDEFPNSQVTIYNGWGDEVYRSGSPYNNDWDGTYQGSPLPVGTYFYIIDFGGARENESGDVRIER